MNAAATTDRFAALRAAYVARDANAALVALNAATEDGTPAARIIRGTNAIAAIIEIQRGGGSIHPMLGLTHDAGAAGRVARAWTVLGTRLAAAKRTIAAHGY